MSLGVIPMRIQVPDLHAGHVYLIDQVISRNDRTLVVLGIKRGLPDNDNPLDYITRGQMLHEMYPDVLIRPLYDNHSNKNWSSELDLLCSSMKSKNVTLYGSRDSFNDSYFGNYKVEIIPPVFEVSGTDIREKLEVTHNTDFRKGMITAVRQMYNNNSFKELVSRGR